MWKLAEGSRRTVFVDPGTLVTATGIATWVDHEQPAILHCLPDLTPHSRRQSGKESSAAGGIGYGS